MVCIHVPLATHPSSFANKRELTHEAKWNKPTHPPQKKKKLTDLMTNYHMDLCKVERQLT